MKTGYITPSEYHEHPLPFSCSPKQVICSEDISYLSCSLILCNFQAVDMESHNDDNDIDLSNDEEVPPGSSTKEPKTSFTTVQVKELGQALEISQLHRSLENISTFLEENFIEDSDDLEQSSDKETTSHFKRKAFDSTFKRPSKRRKSEQCNSATQKSEQCSSAKEKTERCGSPFDPSVNDFLVSSEDEDQTDDSTEDLDISTSIFNDDECFGPKVSDALAKRINEALRANSKR